MFIETRRYQHTDNVFHFLSKHYIFVARDYAIQQLKLFHAVAWQLQFQYLYTVHPIKCTHGFAYFLLFDIINIDELELLHLHFGCPVPMNYMGKKRPVSDHN